MGDFARQWWSATTGVLLVAMMASAAQAQATAAWTTLPSESDMAAAYPVQALADASPGRVTLACVVGEGGVLNECEVASEEPATAGFGAAALGLAGKFRIAPRKSDGSSTLGVHVSIPLRFIPPSEPVAREVRFPNPDRRYSRLGPVGPYYPDRAARMGLIGGALIDCKVGEGGVLGDCKIVRDAPGNYGFGEASLKMATRQYILAAPRPDGKPDSLDEVVRFRVLFGRPHRPPKAAP